MKELITIFLIVFCIFNKETLAKEKSVFFCIEKIKSEVRYFLDDTYDEISYSNLDRFTFEWGNFEDKAYVKFGSGESFFKDTFVFLETSDENGFFGRPYQVRGLVDSALRFSNYDNKLWYTQNFGPGGVMYIYAECELF